MLSNETLRNQLVSRRAFLIGAGKVGLLSLLASRMFYMQLIKSDEYRTLSDKNRISLVIIPPIRGSILDVENRVLATNQKCFRLVLNKDTNKNYKKELSLISQILALSVETQKYIFKKVKKASWRTPVIILDQLNWQQISLVEEHKPVLSSIFVDMGYTRLYPGGSPLGHLTGYMGQINEQEKQELEVRSNISDFSIGKSGLEKYYEADLRGHFGYKQMEVNAFGKYFRELSKLESIPGNDLYLNIDASLQEKIQNYLNKKSCSAVVIDCHNGNVLALASTPVFDPNNFAKLTQDYWANLINDPYKPLLYKAVQSSYPPGSAFKIITVLAALAAGIPTTKIVNCRGIPVLGGNSFRCSRRAGHGPLDMFGAIKHSCNYYMYEIGRLIGPDAIISMAQKFGFGKSTMIDLPGEASGFVPSREWKESKLKSKWTIGDTLNLSIGQGFLLATPIQLARFGAAVANNGKLYTPRVAKNEANFEKVDIKEEYLDILKEAMYQAVNTPGGTAYYSRILDEDKHLAGKTGTAQVQAKAHAGDDLSRASIAWERRNHAVFTGFGPYHNPRYAIAVFVDHGGDGGRAAAPIASKIMLEVLRKYS
jgi:penicillin-binding protein 2